MTARVVFVVPESQECPPVGTPVSVVVSAGWMDLGMLVEGRVVDDGVLLELELDDGLHVVWPTITENDWATAEANLRLMADWPVLLRELLKMAVQEARNVAPDASDDQRNARGDRRFQSTLSEWLPR